MGPLVFPWLLEHPAEITDLQWIITRIAGFLALAAVVWRFIVPVLREKLAERAATIERTRDEVRSTLERVERLRSDYVERLEHIAEESARRMEAAVAEASVLRQHIEEEAGHAAEAIVAHARSEVARDRERAMAHLRIEFAEDVVEAARYAAARTLTTDRQSTMLSVFLSELERQA